jgi:hypothetical protein
MSPDDRPADIAVLNDSDCRNTGVGPPRFNASRPALSLDAGDIASDNGFPDALPDRNVSLAAPAPDRTDNGC